MNEVRMREGCIQGGVCKPTAAAQAQESWELYRRKGLQSFGTCFEDDGSFWPGYTPLERTYLELSELREVLFPYFVDEGDQTGLIPGPGPNTCQESVFNSQPSLHSFTASLVLCRDPKQTFPSLTFRAGPPGVNKSFCYLALPEKVLQNHKVSPKLTHALRQSNDAF